MGHHSQLPTDTLGTAQVKLGTDPQGVALNPCRAMQDADMFFRICFRCSNSLCCVTHLSSHREQGSLIWTPNIEPRFKPPAPEEADLQSYRAEGFCYTKTKNEHRPLSFSCSPIKFSAVPVQYKKHLLSQVPPSICMARVYCTGKLSLLFLIKESPQ